MAATAQPQQEKTLLMTEGSIWKSILLFSVPLILGNLLQQLYNTADSIIVGNFLGSNALAAVGSSGSPIYLLIGFSQGDSPAVHAASMPERASFTLPQRVIRRYCRASSVSSDMFTRESPAAFKSAAMPGNRVALVVRATLSMPGVCAVRSTRPTRPLRTVGSPPVKRMCLMLSWAAILMARETSSRLRMLLRTVLSTPHSGMQYMQRRLQRSVSEMRR